MIKKIWGWLWLPLTATVLWCVRNLLASHGEKVYKEAVDKDKKLQNTIKDNQDKQSTVNIVLAHNQAALDEVNKRIDTVKKDGQWHKSWED